MSETSQSHIGREILRGLSKVDCMEISMGRSNSV